MRPFKYGYSHLRFDLPKCFDAQGADETILLRPDPDADSERPVGKLPLIRDQVKRLAETRISEPERALVEGYLHLQANSKLADYSQRVGISMQGGINSETILIRRLDTPHATTLLN